MIKINLLAQGSIKRQERTEFLVFAVVFVALVFLGIVIQYAGRYFGYMGLENRLALAEQELKKYSVTVKKVDELKATKALLQTKKGVINTLVTKKFVYPLFLDDLLKYLPPNVWFKSLNTKSSDNLIKVTLIAEALDNYSIADLISSLSSSDDFSNIVLGPITSSPGSKDKSSVSSFKLSFDYQSNKKVGSK